MKLELKHLAGYLPYGLNCYGQGEIVEGAEYDEKPIPKLLTITGLDANLVTVEGIRITVDESIMIEDCFPILRPLSDLTKVIEVNVEKFVPSTLGLNLPLDNLISEEILKLKYTTVQKLLEWHFDIFGLIENGLAIDINTLEL